MLIRIVKFWRSTNDVLIWAGSGLPVTQIPDERLRRESVAPPDCPRRHQLGLRVDSDPSPHVAIAEFARVVLGHVFRLGVDERPDLVTLDAPALEIPQGAVLVRLRR